MNSLVAELFEKGWTRVGRGWSQTGENRAATSPRGRQIMRAAQGRPPAVFKPIKKGGCHTTAQLKNQLAYLCQKSCQIIDPSGRYDGLSVLTDKQISRLAERWSDSWSGNPKLGHTTHMMMAFPRGTSIEQVAAITSEICADKFQNALGHFDYLVAVHDDRDHKHAHIVLNRRGADGELFFLSRNHRFNYDAFREAMVEVGERHGVYVEASRRIERSVTTWKAPIEEIYRAKAEGRAPVEEPRTGAALAVAKKTTAESVELLKNLAATAGQYQRSAEATRLIEAASTLKEGQALRHIPGVAVGEYVMFERTLDTVIDRYNAALESAVERIERADPGPRAEAQRQLVESLARLDSLKPVEERAADLVTPPDGTGLYAEVGERTRIAAEMERSTVQARVAQVLEGTGIPAEHVTARIAAGANSVALERAWEGEDLRALAEAKGLDLANAEQFADASRQLEEAQERVIVALRAEGINVGIAAVDEAEDARMLEEGARWLEENREVLRDAERAIRYEAEEGADWDDPGRRVIADHDAYYRVVDELRSLGFDNGAVRDSDAIYEALRDQRPDIPSYAAYELSRTYAEVGDHQRISGPAGQVMASAKSGLPEPLGDRDQILLRDQIAERLSERDLRALEAGDTDVLAKITSDRDEQNALAQAYHEALRAAGPRDMQADRADSIRAGRFEMPQEEFSRAVAAEVAQLRAEGYSRAYISERSFEIEGRVLERYVERRELELAAPEIAGVMKQAASGKVEPLDPQGQPRLVEQIRERLGQADLRELEAGDARVLDRLTENRIEQLELAKAYLQADRATAQGPAMERVLTEIVQHRHRDALLRDTEGGQKH